MMELEVVLGPALDAAAVVSFHHGVLDGAGHVPTDALVLHALAVTLLPLGARVVRLRFWVPVLKVVDPLQAVLVADDDLDRAQLLHRARRDLLGNVGLGSDVAGSTARLPIIRHPRTGDCAASESTPMKKAYRSGMVSRRNLTWRPAPSPTM
jgi:hypothetical protein